MGQPPLPGNGTIGACLRLRVPAGAMDKSIRRRTGQIGGSDWKGCDESMMGKLTLGAAALLAAALMTPVSAAPLSSPTPAAAPADGLVEQVRRRGSGRGHFRSGRSYRHFRHGGRHRHAHRWHRHRHVHRRHGYHRWHGRHHHRHRRLGWAGVPFFYGSSHYGSCSSWRYRCAARYGWHTGRYHRCVWRHGC